MEENRPVLVRFSLGIILEYLSVLVRFSLGIFIETLYFTSWPQIAWKTTYTSFFGKYVWYDFSHNAPSFTITVSKIPQFLFIWNWHEIYSRASLGHLKRVWWRWMFIFNKLFCYCYLLVFCCKYFLVVVVRNRFYLLTYLLRNNSLLA